MGTSTISMVMFNSELLNYQRVMIMIMIIYYVTRYMLMGLNNIKY